MIYYYKATPLSKKRGDNLLIEVYDLDCRTGYFSPIGEETVNTAAYMGNRAIVSQILNRVKGYPLTTDGYGLNVKHVEIRELP
jgi:hypothetical protein